MSSEIAIQGSVIFDSLPYYDNDLEQYPFLKEKVERELAREAKPTQALHPRVPPPPKLFSVRTHSSALSTSVCNDLFPKTHPLLEAELARVESHQSLPPLDTTRYQLPGPSSIPASEEDWKKAVENAHAQLEHLRLRFVFGSPVLTPN